MAVVILAIGDSISSSMCSSISQFTQDMIAVIQKSPPVMGGQRLQSPDERDKQVDAPVNPFGANQSNPEISGDGKLLSGSCAIKSKGEASDKSTNKRKGTPTVGQSHRLNNV